DDPRSPRVDDPTRILVGARPWLDAYEVATLCSPHSHALPAHHHDATVAHYRVQIVSSGGADAAGAIFRDTFGAHTSLVRGSVVTSQGSVTSGNGSADTSVAVALGLLRAGRTAVVQFDAVVDDDLPADVHSVSNQGLVAWSTKPYGQPSDDMATPALDDP